MNFRTWVHFKIASSKNAFQNMGALQNCSLKECISKTTTPPKNESLLNRVGYVVIWVHGLRGLRGCVGCVSQIFTWVTWVKIFFTWVIIFTWVAWVKYTFAWVKLFCLGPKFFALVFSWVKIFCVDPTIFARVNFWR